MVTRVTRLEASRLLKISPSTVDRRIERGECQGRRQNIPLWC